MNDLVEILCRMSQEQLHEFAKACMDKGIATQLEFALHTEQLDADLDFIKESA
jgi:hypothetical protein